MISVRNTYILLDHMHSVTSNCVGEYFEVNKVPHLFKTVGSKKYFMAEVADCRLTWNADVTNSIASVSVEFSRVPFVKYVVKNESPPWVAQYVKVSK